METKFITPEELQQYFKSKKDLYNTLTIDRKN